MSDWDLETDVLVVGAGGCGLMAAYGAARKGVDVVLLEKNSRLGSNTELSSGSVAAAGTRFQRALDIDGTAEQMAEDVLRKNKGKANPEIVLTLCLKARDVVDLLVDEVGLQLNLNNDADRVGHSFRRMHNPPGRSGAPLVGAMHAALGRFPNFTFADHTPVKRLLEDDSGSVTGVMAGATGDNRIKAGKIILATNGFGANKDMLRRYIPEMAEVEYIGSANSTGEGILWGLELGAAVEHMTGYQGHGYICPGYGSRLSPEIPILGGVMVNIHGDRFSREDQGYSELGGVLLKQPRSVGIMVFDQRIHDILAPTMHFREAIESGALRRGETVDELSAALNIDANRLQTSIDECRAGALVGNDRFGRQLFGDPLRPPFYGAYITGGLAHTQGGLKVDVNARVLRTDGSVIPNLYAGGGTSAGISGDEPEGYLSGNGLLSALSSGLIAGEHAASTLRASRN
jgi:fumarate reductase flavoprotein subunit